MASAAGGEQNIGIDVNGPASSLPTRRAGQVDTNIESPSDVGNIPVIEFAVNVSTHDDLSKLNRVLERRGVKMVASNLDDKLIQVRFAGQRDTCETSLDVQSLQKYVEQETGFLAVIKGMGELSSAVAELRPPPGSSRPMLGVVRMSQMTNGACFVDGLIDERTPLAMAQQHQQLHHHHHKNLPLLSLAIHEFGDLSSDNYDSIGEPAIAITRKQPVGRPASISVQQIVPDCDVSKLIGKSMALSLVAQQEANDSNEILSAGVIARASTISGNKKQVCACSGKTLWQERQERQSESQ